jgi:SAM-dependent methyltransferase
VALARPRATISRACARKAFATVDCAGCRLRRGETHCGIRDWGGHHVVGIDESKKLLAQARVRFPTAEFIRARMEEFAFDRPCAAAICWDSLFHLERRHHEPILTAIARCLPSGGRLMFSCGGSAGGAFTDVMFGHEFFYDSNSPAETLGIMERIGFQIVVADLIDKPDGRRNKGRLAIVGEKR